MRISSESFQYLLNVVNPKIAKNDTRFQKAISTAERLCLTLHFLAYGVSQHWLCFSYRTRASTICRINQDTDLAIWDSLNETYLSPPTTTDDWKRFAQDICDLPHCVGAIDGKHVAIKLPLNSGSIFFKYKGYFYRFNGHLWSTWCIYFCEHQGTR